MSSGDEPGRGRRPDDPGDEGGGLAALDDLLVTAAAGGLPGSLREFPDAALPDMQALHLVRAAEQLGVAGSTLLAVRRGRLHLPRIAVDALERAGLRESTTRLYLEQELRSVSGFLDAADVESRVVDGCAVAHLDYRDPQLRAFRQLDLLVRPRTVGRAADVLRVRGWRPPKGADSSDGPPDGVRGIVLVGPSGPRLVLHDHVDSSPAMAVDHQLWSDAEPLTVGGRKLKALGSEQRLLYTSALAVDRDSLLTLVPQRDLVEMVLFGEWRRSRLMDLAASWNALGTLAMAVDAAWRRLAIADVTALSVWAEGYQTDARRRPGRHPTGRQDGPTRHRSWLGLRTRLAGRG